MPAEALVSFIVHQHCCGDGAQCFTREMGVIGITMTRAAVYSMAAQAVLIQSSPVKTKFILVSK